MHKVSWVGWVAGGWVAGVNHEGLSQMRPIWQQLCSLTFPPEAADDTQQSFLGGHESSRGWKFFSSSLVSSFRILVSRILYATDYTQLTPLYGLLLICVERSWLCVRHILIPQPNWEAVVITCCFFPLTLLNELEMGISLQGCLLMIWSPPAPNPSSHGFEGWQRKEIMKVKTITLQENQYFLTFWGHWTSWKIWWKLSTSSQKSIH